MVPLRPISPCSIFCFMLFRLRKYSQFSYQLCHFLELYPYGIFFHFFHFLKLVLLIRQDRMHESLSTVAKNENNAEACLSITAMHCCCRVYWAIWPETDSLLRKVAWFMSNLILRLKLLFIVFLFQLLDSTFNTILINHCLRKLNSFDETTY